MQRNIGKRWNLPSCCLHSSWENIFHLKLPNFPSLQLSSPCKENDDSVPSTLGPFCISFKLWPPLDFVHTFQLTSHRPFCASGALHRGNKPWGRGLLYSLLLILWALSQENHLCLSLVSRHFSLEAREVSKQAMSLPKRTHFWVWLKTPWKLLSSPFDLCVGRRVSKTWGWGYERKRVLICLCALCVCVWLC